MNETIPRVPETKLVILAKKSMTPVGSGKRGPVVVSVVVPEVVYVSVFESTTTTVVVAVMVTVTATIWVGPP